jgi:hypothetical protein
VSRDRESNTGGNIAGLLGTVAFFVGMIMAVVCGAIPATRGEGWVALILVIMGIIVGLFNITSKEVIPVLIAAIALVVVGIGTAPFTRLDDVIDGLGRALNAIVALIAVFMVPAAVINAVRVVWKLARPGED